MSCAFLDKVRPLPKPEEEFENDDYEGVKHHIDEMKTFSHDSESPSTFILFIILNILKR